MRPLTGPLDSRNNPEDVPPLSFRMKLNMEVNDDDKLARSTGWEKLLTQTPYVNQDAHDQGDCFDVNPVRLPITYLYEATSTDGIRRLLRGDRTSVAVLSESTGDWTTVARGFGGSSLNSQIIWKSAQVGNTMVFTNGFDKPQKYTIGAIPAVCGDSSFTEITDLNTLQVDSAGVAASFSGCVFLMDVTQNGTRFPSRVRWSGVNKPTVWVPGIDTVANYQDLPYGETVLAAVELQQNLVIFTDKSIYRCYISGASFGFTRVYTEPLNRDKCLVYPQTLVSDGNNLWWLGRDGFYRWNIYDSEPEATDWLWRSANLVLQTLDTGCCNGPVGCYYPNRKSILWSWPKIDSGCLNYRTIRANLKIGTCDIIDHGFTAFANFRSDQRQTMYEWLDEFCTSDFIGLCAELGSKTINDFCKDCNNAQIFIGASAADFCIKQFGGAYSRDFCLNAATGVGSFGPDGQYVPFVGTYEQEGYFSTWTGMFPLALVDHEKSIKGLLIEPTVQDLLGQDNFWMCRIGTAYQARDANVPGNYLAFAYDTDGMDPAYEAEFSTDGGQCEVLWKRLSDKLIKCPDDRTTAQYAAAAVRPNRSVNWAFLSQGRFLYYQIAVITRNQLGKIVPPVGAAFTVSRMTVDARVLPV